MKLGVIGLGSVGRAVHHALSYYHEVRGYDIDGRGKFEDVLDSEMVFICVSTPAKGGHLDSSNIDSILRQLHDHRYNGIVVVKSTLDIGDMDKFERDHTYLNLVYMPEFLREKSAFPWFVCPDRIVISGNDEDINKVLEAFKWVEDAPVIRMSHREAEIGKLAHNAYIATKVSFTNEIEEISKELGADPQKVMSVIWADRRVKSKDHLTPGLGPYDGKCVPKDTDAIISASSKAVLLKAVKEVNENKREKT